VIIISVARDEFLIGLAIQTCYRHLLYPGGIYILYSDSRAVVMTYLGEIIIL
jgi:hypothetical protein